ISLTVFNPGTREGNEIIAIARLSGVDLQFMLASIIAFIVDMYVINIVYQTIYNATRRLQPIGTWLAVGLALLSALWTDTLIFNLVAELGRGGFSELVVGDFLSKTVSGLVLLPVLIFYINHVAPPQHENSNNRYRPPFDIAHNMFGDWQQKLHQLQFELRSSELNSNQLIRNIREIFWIADENHGNAYFISPAFDDIVGKTRGEFYLSADTIYNRVHPDDVQRVQPRWLSYVEQPHEIEFRLLRDEQEIWLRDRAYLVGDDELNIQRVIGLTEDITMQKQKAQLEKEIEIEKEKIRLLHDLIREVAHDIQSPITALGLKVDLLERVVDNPERQHKYLTQLKRQTLQLSQLVEYLFTLLRVETRPQKRHEIAAIQEMCQQVVDELFPFAQDKDLNIELNLSKQPAPVSCHRFDLRRALTNLIGNAIRYTPQNGTITITTIVDNNTVQVEIEDTGIGISSEDLPHIFDRFYRAGNTKGIDGTGLGLPITYKIIEQHDGIIEVKSELNSGTTFTVKLPIVQTSNKV
ncbi:MAG: ATP-binding protein, partial [Chloroflexota bacterium]